MEDWSRRASKLLQVTITDKEDFPKHLCKNCNAKVLHVEEKLQNYAHKHSQYTLRLLEEKRSVSRKWAKDTNRGIVSPHIIAVCPSAKRQYGALRRIFQQTRHSPFPMFVAKTFFLCTVSAYSRQATSAYGSKLSTSNILQPEQD